MFNILKTHSIFIRFMICNYVFFILFSIIAHIYWNILHTDHNLPVANINTQYLHERTSRMKDPEFRSYPYATHEKSSTKFSCFICTYKMRTYVSLSICDLPNLESISNICISTTTYLLACVNQIKLLPKVQYCSYQNRLAHAYIVMIASVLLWKHNI